ncbi:MAG TPA: RHS repeat-associated core domain-containing protein [Bryobacteraceae bacterium]|nr:RHS repeat-associated core domain-containing protein [Bryobacteraceae bacterium]
MVTLNNAFTVTAPNSISFSVQPGTIHLGQHFAPAVQVTLLDATGHVLTAANGPVTISLKANAASAVLSGTLTQNAVNGVATFPDLSVNRTGTADTLIASSDGLNVTSTPFDVVLSRAQVGACVPASSQSLLVQGPNVSAYLPNGSWGTTTKNVQLVPIEGAGAPATIQTPNPVNSCASNSDTGETVCTANNTDVYLIQGSTLANTLKSGSNAGVGFPFISGGSCLNCGIAMNPAANQAVIGMGLNPGVAGIQILDLNTNTFATPISSNGLGISEGILVDPNLNLVLSPVENNHYGLFDLSRKKVFDFNISGIVARGSVADSGAEDCITGIALAAEEDSSPTQIFLTDLTQATFDTASSTWTAPAQSQSFPEFLNITTAEGIAIASSAHLGLVAGEFGYSGFGVIQLPSTSGSGTPAVLDYVAVRMPNDPSGDRFGIEGDPHTVAAYVSPNDGKAYGVLPSFLLSTSDRYVAIIDLQGLLNAPRSSAHTVAATVDLVATGLVRFVAVGSSPAQMSFVSQPAGAVAGQVFQVKVAIDNALGQVDPNNTFSVTLSVGATRLGSTLPVNGIATFNVVIDQAGTYTLSASTSQLGTITSNSFTITSAAAAKLSFVTQPSNIVAGQLFPLIQVGWQDQFGNPTPSVLPITLALNTNAFGATLSGTTQVTPVNGVASFTAVTVLRTGPFSIVASGTPASGSPVQAQSAFFQVTSGSATQLSFVTQPSTAAAGQIMGNIQVAVEDAFGNTVTNARNTISLALGVNPTGATLGPAGSTSVQALSGLATFFSLTVSFAGVGYTIIASSPGFPNATSAPFNISGSGPPVSLSPAFMRQGESVSVTITATGTHFQQGVTLASFGPGIMVGGAFSGGYGPVTVTSPTTAVAQLSAAAAAAPGFRTVALQTASEQDTYIDAFEVRGIPSLTSISPISGTPGQTLSVTIRGIYTNFVQGSTQATFGAGISVGGAASGGFGPVTVSALGTATAQIKIDSAAAVGLRTPITVRTGAEQAALADGGFLVLGTVTGPPPIPSFTGLTEGMEITTPTIVTGTITSPNLSTWTLDYAPTGSSSFSTLATGTTPAVTGTLDPTLLLNGMNTVRLTAIDQSGQTASTTVNVVVTRNLKVGIFTLSFLDLNIPVAGIPIQIVRTYDSRDKTKADFGVGWSLAIKSVRVDVNGKLGNNWTGTSSGGILPTYCVQPTQNHIATVRLQNGTVYEFQAVPTSGTNCNSVLPPAMVDLTFVPVGSTPPSAQLFQPNATGLIVSGQFPGPLQLLDLNTLGVFGDGGDADQWILTMPNGQSVQVSVTFGVQSITDLNGNTLNIGPTGITSSLGPAVTFGRDSQNRIISIRDPKLNLIQYQYSTAGDLAKVVDQRQNTSSFSYDDNHYLLSFTDPTGAQPVRNVYDDSGRLIEQIDALSRVQDFAHDLTAHQDTFTDYLGNTTTYVYDNHGNIIQKTDALGHTTSSTYDSNDNLLSEANELGKITLYSYDANNNRLSTTDPLGNTTRFTYNAQNQLLTRTDPSGKTTATTYDAAGNVLTLTDALGNTITNTYTNGLLATAADPLGNITTYKYDSNGNLITTTDSLGNVTTFAYDSDGNRLSQTVVRSTPAGQQALTTRLQYDSQNRVIGTTWPDSSTTQTTFNTLGQQTGTTDELGRQTTYSYDPDGRLLSTTYPDGTSTTNTYDAVGNRIAFTDRSGATTTYAYDPLGRLLTTTDALGSAVSSTYDAAGQLISSIDARGNTTRYAYDDAGRQTSITDAAGRITQWSIDANGRQASMQDPASHVTTYQYDAIGRRTEIIYPDGTFEKTTYDPRGARVARTDAAGQTTQFAYDALGRLSSVTDALGGTTRYGYDEVGNSVSRTDASGRITRFAYDQRGRRTSRTLPAGQIESLTYNAAGELTSHTDFNGRTTTYVYDLANRLLSKNPDPSFNAPPVSYSYTPLGRRASMTDASGTTTYSYDSLGRLTRKAAPAGSIAYAYDAAGNLISTQAGTFGVTYAYDSLNRLASVTDPASGTTIYTFDSAGNLSRTDYPNGTGHTYSYDSRNRLTAMAFNRNGIAAASYSYTLDAVGNRMSVAELGTRTVNYNYDAIYRLTGEAITGATTGPNGTVQYTYDPVGNRTQTASTLVGVSSGSSSYDADDRLTSDSYDAAGNTISSDGTANVFDFENRLIRRGNVSIVYDGDGNRVSETVGGTTTNYLIDDQTPTGYAQVIAEAGSDGSSRTYVYGLERISQHQFSSNATITSFYVYDGHGSVRALADGNGVITDTYDYDAFGNLISQTGATVNHFLFAGEQFDPALGIYYNRARYYDERRGRFWSMDPFEGNPRDPESLHKYLYAGANPVNRRDPSGNEDIIDTVGAAEIQSNLSTTVYNVALSAGRNALIGGALGCVRGLLPNGGGCANSAIGGALLGAFLGPLGSFGGRAVQIGLALTSLGMGGIQAYSDFKRGDIALGVFDTLTGVGLGLFQSIAAIKGGPTPPSTSNASPEPLPVAVGQTPNLAQAAIVGHGYQMTNTPTVPEGTYPIFLSSDGTQLPVSVAKGVLATGEAPCGSFSAADAPQPGQPYSDLIMNSARDTSVFNGPTAPGLNVIEVTQDGTFLSDILKPNMGVVLVLACRGPGNYVPVK